MAHFAELDENNVVLRVCVVDNAFVPSDKHADGETWCTNFWGGNWKQTSYNNKFRKRYAGKGFTYDETKDAFIEPKPHPSWTLNETTCQWESPKPYPNETLNADGHPIEFYSWNESSSSWEVVS